MITREYLDNLSKELDIESEKAIESNKATEIAKVNGKLELYNEIRKQFMEPENDN